VDNRGSKRKRKDDKFGYGGPKRAKKSNTAKSTDNMKEFNPKKMKQKSIKKRPGKSKRAHMKK
jgi:rRNA-processing protein EBP2